MLNQSNVIPITGHTYKTEAVRAVKNYRRQACDLFEEVGGVNTLLRDTEEALARANFQGVEANFAKLAELLDDIAARASGFRAQVQNLNQRREAGRGGK